MSSASMFMLHVRGGEGSIETIRRLCAETGWGAFDATNGDLMDFQGDPARGLRKWAQFRDAVAYGIKPKRWWEFWK